VQHLRRPLGDHDDATIPGWGPSPIDTLVTTRSPVEDYVLRDSMTARRCDCLSPQSEGTK
jgi:hypothetical protein